MDERSRRRWMSAEIGLLLAPASLYYVVVLLSLQDVISANATGVLTYIVGAVILMAPVVATWYLAVLFARHGSARLRTTPAFWWLLSSAWLGPSIAGLAATLIMLGSSDRIDHFAALPFGPNTGEDPFGVKALEASAILFASELWPFALAGPPICHLWYERTRREAL